MPNLLLFFVYVAVVATIAAFFWAGILWIIQGVQERRRPYLRRPRSEAGHKPQPFGEMFFGAFVPIGIVICVAVLVVIAMAMTT